MSGYRNAQAAPPEALRAPRCDCSQPRVFLSFGLAHCHRCGRLARRKRKGGKR